MGLVQMVNRRAVKITQLSHLDQELIESAKQKFRQAQAMGVIMSEAEEPVWILSNQKHRFRIKFSYKEDELRQICEEQGVDYQQLIQTLKIYILLVYGVRSIEVLQAIVRFVIEELCASHCCTQNVRPALSFHSSGVSLLAHYMEFLKLVDLADEPYLRFCTDNYMAEAEKYKSKDIGRPCSLAEFESYFLFDWIIRKFWKDNQSEELRLLFFPLYLFWVITTILPLRVTEFLVTPLECLTQKEGKYYLTVRRSKLKGASDFRRIHTYRLKYDYKECRYEIPRSLYDCIAQYRQAVSALDHPYDLLFVLQPVLDGIKKIAPDLKTRPTEKIMGTAELGSLMKAFCRQIVVGRYGLRLITEADLINRYNGTEESYELKPGEMMMPLCKHTRHLAMINLIVSGCNPMMIIEFAGHTRDTTSSNYFGNTSKLVRCGVKFYYDRLKSRKNIIDFGEDNPLSLLLDKQAPSVQVDGGRCYSKAFIQGHYDDCILCEGNHHACKWFLGAQPDATLKKSAEQIDHDIMFIRDLLQSEQCEAFIEETQARLQLIEQEIQNYSCRVFREMVQGDNNDEGKT